MRRESGYYWIKFKDMDWTIGEYYYEKFGNLGWVWLINGDYTDDKYRSLRFIENEIDFTEINERRIISPEEQSNKDKEYMMLVPSGETRSMDWEGFAINLYHSEEECNAANKAVDDANDIISGDDK